MSYRLEEDIVYIFTFGSFIILFIILNYFSYDSMQGCLLLGSHQRCASSMQKVVFYQKVQKRTFTVIVICQVVDRALLFYVERSLP